MRLGFLQFAAREAMMLLRSFVATALVLSCFSAAPASAHFKLLKPASWLKEDSTGGPQKGSPCGPGNSGFLGDDVQPVPTSGMVTEFKAGDEIEIELDETIPHPGYFRVAIAKDRSEFTIPPVDNAMSCALDLSKVKEGAHDNILADGLWKEESQPAARHLTTKVKLPNEPCEKCTIQVVQVMKDHGLNSCYYYHCADIKITGGAASGTAGTGAAAGSGGSAATAGTGASAGTGAAGAAGSATAGAGGAAGSAAGAPASSTAGAPATAGTGAAGRASAAGTSAAPSGSAGKPATTTGAAGQGTSTSPATAAGATAAAGGAAPAAPPAEESGCAVASPGAGTSGVGGGLALLAVALLFRRRRSARAGRTAPVRRVHV